MATKAQRIATLTTVITGFNQTAAAMNAGEEHAVPLKEHLPVHIGYFTAWVNPDGSVAYTDDPYNLDQDQSRLLA